MNNEPVAWLVKNMEIVPLYTHPVKELTISIVDVDNLAKQFWYNEGSGFHFHYYDFALAILRKASEK